MVGEIFVKLRGSCSDFTQVVPWGIGEIMVLDVISNIKVKEIPYTYVIIGFHPFDELVVLSDDVDGGGVRSD